VIIEVEPNFRADLKGRGHCAYCAGSATRLLNLPGNVLVPACSDPGCPSAEVTGALEVEDPNG